MHVVDLIGVPHRHITLAVLEVVWSHLWSSEALCGTHPARPNLRSAGPGIVSCRICAVVVGITLVLSAQVEVHIHQRQEVCLSICEGGGFRRHLASGTTAQITRCLRLGYIASRLLKVVGAAGRCGTTRQGQNHLGRWSTALLTLVEALQLTTCRVGHGTLNTQGKHSNHSWLAMSRKPKHANQQVEAGRHAAPIRELTILTQIHFRIIWTNISCHFCQSKQGKECNLDSTDSHVSRLLQRIQKIAKTIWAKMPDTSWQTSSVQQSCEDITIWPLQDFPTSMLWCECLHFHPKPPHHCGQQVATMTMMHRALSWKKSSEKVGNLAESHRSNHPSGSRKQCKAGFFDPCPESIWCNFLHDPASQRRGPAKLLRCRFPLSQWIPFFFPVTLRMDQVVWQTSSVQQSCEDITIWPIAHPTIKRSYGGTFLRTQTSAGCDEKPRHSLHSSAVAVPQRQTCNWWHPLIIKSGIRRNFVRSGPFDPDSWFLVLSLGTLIQKPATAS